MSEPLPVIESAFANINTALCDAAMAKECWQNDEWSDAAMWCANAAAQLKSAEAKILKHAQHAQHAQQEQTCATRTTT